MLTTPALTGMFRPSRSSIDHTLKNCREAACADSTRCKQSARFPVPLC